MRDAGHRNRLPSSSSTDASSIGFCCPRFFSVLICTRVYDLEVLYAIQLHDPIKSGFAGKPN